MEEIRHKIESTVQKVIDASGMELIELKVSGHKNDVFIQVIADMPSGGITIEECAIINKSLAAAIEEEKVLDPEVFPWKLLPRD